MRVRKAGSDQARAFVSRAMGLMGSWVALCVAAPVALAQTVATAPEINRTDFIGDCRIVLFNENSAFGQSASVRLFIPPFSSLFAGGTVFFNSAVETRDPLPLTSLAPCFGPEGTANVTDFAVDGAEGTPETDADIGFSFRLRNTLDVNGTEFPAGAYSYFLNGGVTVPSPGGVPTATTLSLPSTPATFGETVPVSVTVAAIQPTQLGAPQGNVEIRNATTNLVVASGTLDAQGEAAFSLGGPPVGTTNLFALYAGGGGFQASESVSGALSVLQAQTINFTSVPPPSPTIGGSYTPAATATSGLPVSFSIATQSTGICQISAGVVSFTAGGVCTVNADQSGNEVYLPAPRAAQSVTIAKRRQVIAFGNPAPEGGSFVGERFAQAPVSSSGLPVTLSVAPESTNVCSLNAGEVAFNASGECVVIARQDGDTEFDPAPDRTLTIPVARAATAAALTASPSAPSLGQAVTLTTSIDSDGKPAAAGEVAFADGATALGVAQLQAAGIGLVSVGAGDSHSCALSNSGRVWCWGLPSALGTGQAFSSPGPVLVPGLTGVKALAVGGGHNCAALADGTAQCWGRGTDGQLGNAASANSATPVVVSGLTGVTAIGAGDNHSCALTANAGMFCWGRGTDGQLGNGAGDNRNVPQSVSGLTGATALSLGGAHTCAVTPGGSVSCWGRNNFGQLGIGNRTSSSVPVAISGLSGVTGIGAGFLHSCALLSDGTVQCWGLGLEGQMGNGNTSTSETPVQVTGISGAATLAVGDDHACVVTALGGVACWGSNTNGQLGIGNQTSSSTPVDLPGLSGISALAGGFRHTCAIASNGAVSCWGANGSLQLGIGGALVSTTPVPVAVSPDVSAFAAGGTHGCAVTPAGGVACWGRNAFGQLGDGGTLSRPTPLPVSGLTGIKAVVTGSNHSCALTNTGTVFCWGSGSSGQLGNGASVSRSTPVAVSGLSDATALSAAGDHTCALVSGGFVMCWGSGSFGQLGNAANQNRNTPVEVSGLSGVRTVAAGISHSCASTFLGSVFCWGRGADGQLGTGTTDASNTPVQVVSMSGALMVTAGAAHSCALLADGAVSCWGRGTDGQLGDGNNLSNASPVAVSGLSGVTALASGQEHSCALMPGGTMSCWGRNAVGQLGDGTRTNRNVPVAVPDLSGVTTIALGGGHSCAAVPASGLQCWGNATSGQIGLIPPLPSATTPTPIRNFTLLNRATASLSAPTPVAATRTLSAAFAATATHAAATASATIDVQPALTTTTLSADRNPSLFGEDVTFTADVTSAFAGTIGGTVELRRAADQGVVASATLGASGRATLTVSTLPAGTTGLTAHYLGAGNYAASASTQTLSHTVTAAPSTVALALEPETVAFGDTATLKLSVVSVANTPAPVHPAGNFRISVPNGPQNVVVAAGTDGKATYVVPPLTAGIRALVVEFTPTNPAEAGPGSAIVNLNVNKAEPVFDIRWPTATLPFGEALELPLIVTGPANAPAGPTGDVFLRRVGGFEELARTTLDNDGEATLSLPFPLAPGEHPLEVVFDGDSNYVIDEAPPVTVVVAKAPSTTALEAAPDTLTFGDAIMLQARVEAGLIPQGSVTFKDGAETLGTAPLTADSKSAATKIARNSEGLCFIANAGDVFCIGLNTDGNLGNGFVGGSGTLQPSKVIGLDRPATALSTFGTAVCALLDDGSVWCWGWNREGIFMRPKNDLFNAATPLRLDAAGTGNRAVSVGFFHACLINAEGGAECWGNNDNGQLGDGTTDASLVPVQVAGLETGVAEIVAGGTSTCALLQDGTVRCWGENDSGQLGLATDAPFSTVPVTIQGLPSSVTMLASTGLTSCAAATDGFIRCWGENNFGNLDGDPFGSLIRTAEPILSPMPQGEVVALTVAGGHSCAALKDGTARCWGFNNFGQLGQGTGDYAPGIFPVAIGPSPIIALKSGFGATAAVTADGQVKWWGFQMVATSFGRSGEPTPQTLLGAPQVSAPAVATLSAPLRPAGTRALSAAYGGSDMVEVSSGTASALVNKRPVNVSPVQATASNVTYGSPVTLTAFVTGDINATGRVRFFHAVANGGLLGEADIANGAASITVSRQNVLTFNGIVTAWPVYAVYDGDANHLAGTGPTTSPFTIRPLQPQMSFERSVVPPMAYGDPVTLTVKLSSAVGVPDGEVTFRAGTQILRTIPVNGGRAEVTLDTLPAGTFALTARFDPDSTNFAPVDMDFPAMTINTLRMGVSVAATPAGPAFGDNVELTATLAPALAPPAGTFPEPGGFITFLLDGSEIGLAAVEADGRARITLQRPAEGLRSVQARYGGDMRHTSALSALQPLTIQPNGWRIVLAPSVTELVASQPLSLTATLTNDRGRPLQGRVRFLNGETVVAERDVVNGQAVLPLGPSLPGTRQFTAEFNGAAASDIAVSAPVTITARRAEMTLALTASTQLVRPGAPVTLAASASPRTPARGAVTGPVTFLTGSTPLGRAELSGGSARLSAVLPFGRQTLSLRHAGDSVFAAAASPPVQVEVTYAEGVPATLDPAPGIKAHARLLVLGADGHLALWAEPAAHPGQWRLAARRIGASGTPAGAVRYPALFNSAPASLDAAILANGRLAIAWTLNGMLNTRQFNLNAALTPATPVVSVTAASQARDVRIAAVPNGFALAWHSGTAANTSLMAVRLRVDGSLVGPPRRVATPVAPAALALAAFSDGALLLGYNRLSPQGVPRPSLQMLNPDMTQRGQAVGLDQVARTRPAAIALVASGLRSFAAAWDRPDAADGTSRDIVMRRFAAPVTPTGPMVVVNGSQPGDQHAPALARLAGRGWMVAWRDGRASGLGIAARMFDAQGVPLEAVFGLSAPAVRAGAPVAAGSADGVRALALWPQAAVATGNATRLTVRGASGP